MNAAPLRNARVLDPLHPTLIAVYTSDYTEYRMHRSKKQIAVRLSRTHFKQHGREHETCACVLWHSFQGAGLTRTLYVHAGFIIHGYWRPHHVDGVVLSIAKPSHAGR